MSSPVVSCPSETASHEVANAAFETLLPELQSRATRMVRRYPASMRRDAADDALARMFLNHAQAARKGISLRPSDLGHYAALYLRERSLETHRGYPSRVGARMVRLQDVWIQGRGAAVGRALATSEREDPAERVRIKLDWAALCSRLDRRRQKIILGLAVGESKSGIATQLGVSRGRLSQLLEAVQHEVGAYLGDEPAEGLRPEGDPILGWPGRKATGAT